jgi:hypothetical protein
VRTGDRHLNFHETRDNLDRGKAGSKYHLLVDARGLPLNVLVSAANRHDSLFVEPLLDTMPAIR